MLWFAAITAVPFTFSLGFLAGTMWRSRAYGRTLEGVLGRDLLLTKRDSVTSVPTLPSLN